MSNDERPRDDMEVREWQLVHIQQGIADSEAGRTFTFEEARERVLQKGLIEGKKRD